jgi:hypothetical protein
MDNHFDMPYSYVVLLEGFEPPTQAFEEPRS